MCDATVDELAEKPTTTLVKLYKALEANIAAAKAEYEESIKADADLLERVGGAIAMKLDKEGVNSMRTEFGTPMFTTRMTAKVTDPEKYFAWVLDNRATDVLTSAVSKDALRARGYEAPGEYEELGITVQNIRTLSVRKPT